MDNLFNLIFKAASVEPRYDEEICLAAGKTRSCTACRDVCPHQAITISRRVQIDDVDCTGCGLCVQACPTQALEAKVSLERSASVKCSRVSGDASTVHCLGRLQATDLLRLAGSGDTVTLAHGDCADCPIGTAAVLEAVRATRADAVELAQLHGRTLAVDIGERRRLDGTSHTGAMSRRELLRGGWRSVQERAVDMLAPLDPGDEELHLPVELQRRYRVIAAARPEQEQLVPWTLPRISDECIMCPLCTNACPTGAIERTFEGDGQGVLHLKPDHCMGCDACMDVCPVSAVAMDERISWSELSGGKETAYRRDPSLEHPGSIAR